MIPNPAPPPLSRGAYIVAILLGMGGYLTHLAATQNQILAIGFGLTIAGSYLQRPASKATDPPEGN